MFKKVLAGAVFAASMTAAVQAQESGFYLVADAGHGEVQDMGISRSEVDNELGFVFGQFGVGVIDSNSSLDDSDTTFSLGAGYSLNQYFAVELAYVDLGEVGYKASGTLTDGVSVVDANISALIEAQGIALSAVGSYPFTEKFSGFVRGGAFFSDVEGTAKVSFGDISDTDSNSDDDVEYQLGLGVQYAVTETWAVRAEFSRIFDLGNDEIGETDFDRYTLGVTYSF